MRLDNRGLEPPQPMVRTLKALETMENGATLTIINDRRPMFLYPELEERGYSHSTTELSDGAFEIKISKEGQE
jgi:tRNA 2-thiouridine synthesizing protein A